MEGLFVLFFGIGLFCAACLICGPIALIMVINLSKKVDRLFTGQTGQERERFEKPQQEKIFAVEEKRGGVRRVEEIMPVEKMPGREAANSVLQEDRTEESRVVVEQQAVTFEEKVEAGKEKILLEQKIGTRWILVAGIITLFVGAAFFLRFAYENFSMSPLSRVVTVAMCGIAALVIGEITRRRGYEVVAKGVTALGFAILYADVFSAYQFYNLIGSVPAFVLATAITIGAMTYAVVLNEILIAFLSLLGGFGGPVMMLGEIGQPSPLFVYVLVLGIGAMLCGAYRKWQAVNFLSFAGTYLLFSIWFSEFSGKSSMVDLMTTKNFTLTWLSIYFLIYLVMPIIYELVKKVKTSKEDVLLILANAIVTYSYLCYILNESRFELAVWTTALAGVHFVMTGAAWVRCKEDVNLRVFLITIGLLFSTIAMPLYFKANALVIAWACQAVALTVIGIRYESGRLQISAMVPLVLSCVALLKQFPREEDLEFIFNRDFGTWLIAAGAVFVMHLIYRFIKSASEDIKKAYEKASQLLYCLGWMFFATAVIIELQYKYEWIADNSGLWKGVIGTLMGLMLVLITRPICPKGTIHKFLGGIAGTIGAVFTILVSTSVYRGTFRIFANEEFGIVLGFVLILFAGAWILKNSKEENESDNVLANYFGVAGVIVLWAIVSEQIYNYWYCLNKYGAGVENWKLLAHMYLSISWAVYGAIMMIIGFWKKVRALRYMAIGLFGILLLKVFIFDTQAMENIYRIMAFAATGVTLIGVSYMYQFLKKKGFFELIRNKVES